MPRSKCRPRHSRTKVGCLTCRGRKKKCDEAKPRCGGCRRNMLPCIWPSHVSGASYISSDAEATPLSSAPAPVPVPAPAPGLYAGPDRAIQLTPQSTILFSHFIRETAACFAMAPLADNPFITILLPLSCADDLLMHCVLAFSGAHLSYKEPASVDVARATGLHYSQLISGLRTALASFHEDDLETTERLLRILTLTCHYEAVSGDTEGKMFKHLNASRRLLLPLLTSRPMQRYQDTAKFDSLRFSIELYSYLVFCNTIVPCGLVADHTKLFEPMTLFLNKPQDAAAAGAVFAGSYELFQMIPDISLLASRRLAEEAAALVHPGLHLQCIHNGIISRIESWQMPTLKSGESMACREQMFQAAEIFRQGLYIYLLTAMGGSVIIDDSTRAIIQGHIDNIYTHAVQLVATRYISTMLWPIIIAATCMVNPQEQCLLLQEFRTSWYRMKHLSTLGNVLELLWADLDPRAYGPYGLYLTMRKHGLKLGLA